MSSPTRPHQTYNTDLSEKPPGKAGQQKTNGWSQVCATLLSFSRKQLKAAKDRCA
jgi:hypothetical protein